MSFSGGGKRRSKIRTKLLLRQGGICAICDLPIADGEASVDHIIPRSMGGPDAQENLRVVHHACNLKRADNLQPSEVHLARQRALAAMGYTAEPTT